MLTNPAVLIFAALLGALSIWFGVATRQEDVLGNLLPELIGFCLEGMFFVGIFAWMQERRELRRKTELRASLVGAMSFICPIINSALPGGEQVQLAGDDSWARQARSNGPRLKQLAERVSAHPLALPQEQVLAIRELIRARLATLDSLLAVSAQLSHAHLSAYNLLLTEVHRMAETNYFDGAELGQSFSSFLRLLIGFTEEDLQP